MSRSADTGRRPKPSDGILGVLHFVCPGDWEYTEDPTIVLAFIEKRPNLDCNCGAGEFSTGMAGAGKAGTGALSTSFSGRGVLIPKIDIDDRNIVVCRRSVWRLQVMCTQTGMFVSFVDSLLSDACSWSTRLLCFFRNFVQS